MKIVKNGNVTEWNSQERELYKNGNGVGTGTGNLLEPERQLIGNGRGTGNGTV